MDVAVLQVVRLKGGMADAKGVAAATGRGEDEAAAALGELVAAEAVQERKGRHKVTREGRDQLDALLASEREGIDADGVKALYEEFEPFNAELKEIANAWQMRGEEPNDHADADYDAGVLERLDDLHRRFAPLAGRVAELAPRLAPYPGRLDNALAQVRAGEQQFLLSPMVDSYHQVWFELHEDLIGLAGLHREDEAAAGRAE